MIKVRFIPYGYSPDDDGENGLYIEKELPCLPPLNTWVKINGKDKEELQRKIDKVIHSNNDHMGVGMMLDDWVLDGTVCIDEMNWVMSFDCDVDGDVCYYVGLGCK